MFATFPELYQGHGSSGHIKFIQRFLYCYSLDTKRALVEGGGVGIDGGFGVKTEEAVKRFQDDFKDTSAPLVVDGRPGEKTWRKIAELMVYGDENHFVIAMLDDGQYYDILYHVLIGNFTRLSGMNQTEVSRIIPLRLLSMLILCLLAATVFAALTRNM